MPTEPVEPGLLRSVLRERWDILLVIAVGGALGSIARWALAESVPHARDQIAVSTWIINVTGAFAIGLLLVFVIDVWPPTRYVRPFFAVGVLGGYTTFSTYMLDTLGLLAGGRVLSALIYVFGTVVTGLVAVWAGMVLARAITVVTLRLQETRRDR